MSTSSANPVQPSTRTTLLAAGGGVVLLALVLGFVVGLPKAEGGETSGSGGSDSRVLTDLAPLPDTLPGDLVSLSSPDMPPELVAQTGGADRLAAVTGSAAENLTALFGGPADFEIYGKVDGSALLTVTVGPGEPGLFVPDGAPVSADVQGVTRSDLEVVRVADDTVCSVLYAQAASADAPADPAEQPSRVHCQLGSAGLLYDVTGQGLSTDDVVAATNAVRDLEEDPAT